ncbi:MAG: transposase family protein [Pseudomonadota bacterium]
MIKDGGCVQETGAPAKDFANFPACSGCARGEGFHLPKKGRLPDTPVPTRPFQAMQMDHSGSVNTKGLSRTGAHDRKQFFTLVDVHTGVKFACSTKSTDAAETILALRQFAKSKVEAFGFALENLQTLQGDGATPFSSAIFREFAAEHAISLRFNAPHCSFTNPFAERGVGTLSMRARTCLLDAELPIWFWPHAISFACFCENRLPRLDSKTGKWLAPLERLTGKRHKFENTD